MTKQERAKDLRLRRTYGKTLAWFKKQQKKQNNKCAMCGRPPKKLALSVDHNHKSGKVRGLLCIMCNRRVLGWIERLKVPPQNIVAYLLEYDPDNDLVKGYSGTA